MLRFVRPARTQPIRWGIPSVPSTEPVAERRQPALRPTP